MTVLLALATIAPALAGNPMSFVGVGHNAFVDDLAQTCALAPAARDQRANFAADLMIERGLESSNREALIQVLNYALQGGLESDMYELESAAFIGRFEDYLALKQVYADGAPEALQAVYADVATLDELTKTEFDGYERMAMLSGSATLVHSLQLWTSDSMVVHLPGDDPPTFALGKIDGWEIGEADFKGGVGGALVGGAGGGYLGALAGGVGAIPGGGFGALGGAVGVGGLMSFFEWVEQDAVRDYIEENEGEIGGTVGPCTPPFN